MPGIVEPPSDVHRGVIHRLEVDNFKSYKGHQVIGPFMNFTAVIGPNGAGKSNLMDAISFVLGVRSSHLRGAQLRDLIYAADDTERERPGRRASVSLVYRFVSPDAATSDRELTFTRAITPAGASEYRVDGSVVSWDEYCARLKQLGILVKAKNCLVFQGDVESIAAKSPKDLTVLFEQISGSDELRKEYETKERKKLEAEDKLLLAQQKRKAVLLEKRQKKEQKDEAQAHMKKQEELKGERAKYFLWQLLCLERDIEDAKAQLAEKQQALQQLAEEQLELEGQMKEKQKERREHSAAVTKAEKEVAKKQGEIEKKRPAVLRMAEEIGRSQQRLEADTERLTELKAARDEHSTAVKQLQRQVADMEMQLEEVKGRGQRERRELVQGQELMAEYNKLKEEAGVRTSRLREEQEALERLQQADAEARRNLEASVALMTSREEQLGKQKEQAELHREEMRKEVGERRQGLEQLGKKEQEMIDKHRRARHRVENLRADLAAKDQQLRELKADVRESEREVRLRETVASLRRLFPGVKGRLAELCDVPQRKYTLAVTVAFGKLFDAVAVDTEATAKTCIEYLREQRLPPMTFIPLATARVSPADERLRALGGSACLALDAIEYREEVEVAMLYALGSTLVCNSLDEARELAWGDGERHKVVTLDGTLLAKNGCMTGGSSGGMEERSQQWDRQEVEKVKAERQQLAKLLAEAEAVRDAQAKEAQMQASIATARKRLEFAEAEEKMATEKAQRLAKELENITKEKTSKEPQLQELADRMAGREAELEVKQRRVNDIADRIFQAFSRKVGVASVREYEETQLRDARLSAERQLAVSNQLAKLKTQLEYEESRDTEGPVTEMESRVEEKRAALNKLTEQAQALQQGMDKLKKELAKQQKPLAEAKARVEAVEQELQELSKQARDRSSKMGGAKRNVTAKETTLVQLRSRRSELLETCSMEQVEVQAKDGLPLALPLLLPPGMASESQAAEGGGSGAEPMMIDGPGASGGGTGSGAAGGSGDGSGSGTGSSSGIGVGVYGGRPGMEDVPLDYSILDRRLQQKMSEKKREEVGSELLAHIESLRAALEASAAPNMKAVEQFEQVAERERTAAREVEDSRKEEKEAREAFMTVQQERVERFMACFSHVTSAIDPIYKALTTSSLQPVGGTAYLVLENEAEPFTAGVKFSAMPPSKRFRDMEQLSGGEKTVAALALLFAIHSFRPSPFFVLDEVDAALDNLNVAKVANFIRNRSRHLPGSPADGQRDGEPAGEGVALEPQSTAVRDNAALPGFQSIVISLKDQFFSTADALVGVVRDQDTSSSKTLTFDLNRYRP